MSLEFELFGLTCTVQLPHFWLPGPENGKLYLCWQSARSDSPSWFHELCHIATVIVPARLRESCVPLMGNAACMIAFYCRQRAQLGSYPAAPPAVVAQQPGLRHPQQRAQHSAVAGDRRRGGDDAAAAAVRPWLWRSLQQHSTPQWHGSRQRNPQWGRSGVWGERRAAGGHDGGRNAAGQWRGAG